ncbi:MAG: hypothetical protein ACLGH5_09480, partial [Actinomycetes bacterium]
MSEDAPRAANAARVRDLERRAFARPTSRAAAADAAAAAAELARLRPAALVVRARVGSVPAEPDVRRDTASRLSPSVDPHETSTDGDPDLPPALGERLTAAATALATRALRRARALTRRDIRRAGVTALALGLAATVAGVVHAA